MSEEVVKEAKLVGLLEGLFLEDFLCALPKNGDGNVGQFHQRYEESEGVDLRDGIFRG